MQSVKENKECPKCGGSGQVIDAEALRMRRRRKTKTLNTVASAMGITQSYLSDLENGRRDWNGDLKERFEAALRGS